MKKTTIHILIVNGVLLLLALACLLTSLTLSGRLESQKAAQRWAGEGDIAFAQLSCFMSEGDTLSLGSVYGFRQTLLTKFTEASMTAPENGSLYHDAWSAFGKLTVTGDPGRGEANVTAVGGDWFFFHPLRLLSGSYITESDMMDDRVVLDEELAWRLFGGYDLAGMTVTINETPYVVAGVVAREQDFASRKANSDTLGMYMGWRAWTALNAEAPIECYEVVLPQPVDGFAEDLFKSTFPVGGGEVVNNTERFDLAGVYGIIRDFGSRSMHLNSVIYPYWENAARYLGDWCALFLALAIALAVSPAVTFFVMLMIGLIRAKDYLSEKIPELVANAIDRPRQRRWEREKLKQTEQKEAAQ